MLTLQQNINQKIQSALEGFVRDLTKLIRQEAMMQIASVLDAPVSQRPKALPAKRKRAPVQSRALTRIQKAKHPVTVKKLAKSLGSTENNTRQILAKLMKQKLVSANMVGDGTARKAYLPAKT